MPRIQDNVRFTFAVWKRIYGLDAWEVPEGACWTTLANAKAVRNDIAHPTRAEELIVSDDQLETVVSAADWFGSTHKAMTDAMAEKLEQVGRGEDSWPHPEMDLSS